MITSLIRLWRSKSPGTDSVQLVPTGRYIVRNNHPASWVILLVILEHDLTTAAAIVPVEQSRSSRGIAAGFASFAVTASGDGLGWQWKRELYGGSGLE
jgi:hypothetical protein